MYFAEHKFLGDTTLIPGHEGTEKVKQFQLHNGLVVSYGDVNGFGGDYFGHERPISSDKIDMDKMKANFLRWYDLLATVPTGKAKAEALRAALKPLNDKVEQVLKAGSTADQVASVYQKNPLDIWELDKISQDPKWAPNGAGFNKLLATNVDHFGYEARLAYNAGHALALDYAVKGDLDKALTINAFADHFLEDSFAAGHLRVPRAQIMEVSLKAGFLPEVINASANVMHEEDGALGVWVKSPSGEVWKAFGDGRLPGLSNSSKSTSSNLVQCRKALDQSVKEVVAASENKSVIQPSDFSAWYHAPIIEAIDADPDNHLPLLKVQDGKVLRRRDGPRSGRYEEIGFFGWPSFYLDNAGLIDGQIRLIVKKYLGIDLP